MRKAKPIQLLGSYHMAGECVQQLPVHSCMVNLCWESRHGWSLRSVSVPKNKYIKKKGLSKWQLTVHALYSDDF